MLQIPSEQSFGVHGFGFGFGFRFGFELPIDPIIIMWVKFYSSIYEWSHVFCSPILDLSIEKEGIRITRWEIENKVNNGAYLRSKARVGDGKLLRHLILLHLLFPSSFIFSFNMYIFVLNRFFINKYIYVDTGQQNLPAHRFCLYFVLFSQNVVICIIF